MNLEACKFYHYWQLTLNTLFMLTNIELLNNFIYDKCLQHRYTYRYYADFTQHTVYNFWHNTVMSN